jgi:hypothetical protein
MLRLYIYGVPLTYSVPVLPMEITEENLPVLPIVQYDGPWWTIAESFFSKKDLTNGHKSIDS